MRKSIYIFSILLIFPLSLNTTAKNTEHKYFQFNPPILKTDPYPDFYSLGDDLYVYIKYCTEENVNTPKLFMVEKVGDQYIEKYRSSGSGDAFFLRPSFFKTKSGEAQPG